MQMNEKERGNEKIKCLSNLELKIALMYNSTSPCTNTGVIQYHSINGELRSVKHQLYANI